MLVQPLEAEKFDWVQQEAVSAVVPVLAGDLRFAIVIQTYNMEEVGPGTTVAIVPDQDGMEFVHRYMGCTAAFVV